MVSENPVLIVGAGLSGLSCGCTLDDAGIPYLIFDKSRRVGGRVATIDHAGYKLDLGFQVLLTFYPEAQRFFDYDTLNLRPCYPGSMVWHDGRFHRFSDPLRRPLESLSSLFCPIGSFKDKIRIGMMRVGLLKTTSLEDCTSTIAALRKLGFGDSMIERFWRPFMSGVFLENELSTSVRKFEETFHLFAKGHTTIPKLGIGELPKQMVRKLDKNRLLLGKKISSLSEGKVKLESGRTFCGREVVLAVDGSERERMLGLEKSTVWNSVECIYFGLPEKKLPSVEPILYLDGEGTGPINNLFFTSNLSDCAPKGKALASASVITSKGTNKDEDLVNAALTQLKKWFGASVNDWQLIKRYKIPKAIPRCIKPTVQELKTNGIYQCGDYNGLPSIDAALKSGRLVAEKIIEDRN